MGRQKLPKQRKGIVPAMPLLFRFDMRPHAQERLQHKLEASGKTRVWMPPKTANYEAEISRQALEQHCPVEPFTGDLAMIINLRVPHRRHGDIDNMVKSILDGMQPKFRNGEQLRGGIFRNDKCIKKMHVEIFYDGEMLEACSEVILYKHTPRPWAIRIAVRSVHLWEKVSGWFNRDA